MSRWQVINWNFIRLSYLGYLIRIQLNNWHLSLHLVRLFILFRDYWLFRIWPLHTLILLLPPLFLAFINYHMILRIIWLHSLLRFARINWSLLWLHDLCENILCIHYLFRLCINCTLHHSFFRDISYLSVF